MKARKKRSNTASKKEMKNVRRNARKKVRMKPNK